MNEPLGYRTTLSPVVVQAMERLARPGRGYISCAEALTVLLDAEGARLSELASLPLASVGQKLVALRYLLHNGATWRNHFNWERTAARVRPEGPDQLRSLFARIDRLEASSWPNARTPALETHALGELAAQLARAADDDARGLALLSDLTHQREARVLLRQRLWQAAPELCRVDPRAADVLYLASFELSQLPATTVGEGDLAYVIVADKGEMGVRAVRETIALGLIPVVLYSQQDDHGALQVRLAHKAGGFSIPLKGGFRESYANYVQIARAVLDSYRERFEADAERQLARSALYPGYGPLAENNAAIEHFRKHGIVFVGPTQDVVERAGDKRKFRLLAESIDRDAVVPGVVIDEIDADAIVRRIEQGHAEGRFAFPGRLKAANGGGGRGQVVVKSADAVPAAVQRVLGEIAANGWEHGVMFEQNIPETVHLEVQVLRDRFGNTCHFGMRDCTEQRASQKIQEEAPPALLRNDPALMERICNLAKRIADEVGYVGACTVELMYKGGHFYLLEMNTRIQVEHPVTEAAHRVRRADGLAQLNLVQLQLLIARGQPLPFAQEDIVCTHVAREFRINAESWRPELKDSRDGKPGLFVPNAGAF
ncbi:MAG TPA: biotin carboxylase N-terminal domain-containing protein, partial [Polyangiales bacterium]